jgi:hypothetical protein
MKSIIYAPAAIIKIRGIFKSILLSGLLLLVAAKGLGQCTITLTSDTGTDNQTVCVKTAITNITYSTAAAKGATVNPLPAGVKVSWKGDNVTISGTPTESGTFYYTVKLKGDCSTVTATGTITVNPLPGAAGTITGTATVCQGATSVAYSVPVISNATGYIWAYSGTGITITGETTNSVTVIFAANATSGNLTVRGVNSCGSGAVSDIYKITVKTLPSAITGTTNVDVGSTTILSSTPAGGTWSSGSPAVAIINSSTGEVTGVSKGTSLITYTLPTGCSVSMVFTVLPSGWKINPLVFTYHGLVTAQVFVDGTAIESGFLAAFVGGECRGIVESGYNSSSGNYLFYLTCYSDSASGDVMIFKYYNPSEDMIYNMDRSIDFVTNMTAGTELAPIKMDVGTDITVAFPVGWNWFSVNTTLDNMTLKFILSPVAAEGDYIKSQVASATYFTGYGWFGSLTVLEPVKLYKIKVQNSSGITFSGKPVNVISTQIPVVNGWNWIGYLPQETLPISAALSSLYLTDLDYIKSQASSATYYSGYGWFGSLINLSPYQGYMIKLSNSGTLLYPDSGKKGSQILSENEQLLFDPSDFEFNGSVMAKVLVDGVPKGSANDLLYAYVNDEIRGVIGGEIFPPTQTWTYTLMVHSNVREGETVSFRYYNAENKKYYTCNETITFSEDMIIANAIAPFELHADAIAVYDGEFVNEELSLHTYPNPFEHSLNIEYDLIESTQVRITVFDTYGKTIRILVDQKQEPGNYLIKWDPGLTSGGTYFIKLEEGHNQRIQKAILLR